MYDFDWQTYEWYKFKNSDETKFRKSRILVMLGENIMLKFDTSNIYLNLKF